MRIGIVFDMPIRLAGWGWGLIDPCRPHRRNRAAMPSVAEGTHLVYFQVKISVGKGEPRGCDGDAKAQGDRTTQEREK